MVTQNYQLILRNAQGATEETFHDAKTDIARQVRTWNFRDMTATVYDCHTGKRIYDGPAGGAHRAGAKPQPSRSGPNIPEAQRTTVQRKLRLSPERDAKLVRLAAAAELDVSEFVGRWLDRKAER